MLTDKSIMHTNFKNEIQSIKDFILSEGIKEKYTVDLPTVPQQNTNFDCGIFIMEFARNIIFKSKITDVMVNDIDNIRKIIKNELVGKKLLFK